MKILKSSTGFAFLLLWVIFVFTNTTKIEAGEAEAAIAFSRGTSADPEWEDAWSISSLSDFKNASAFLKSQESAVAVFFAIRTNQSVESFQYFVTQIEAGKELMLPSNSESNRIAVSQALDIYLLLFDSEDFRKSPLKSLLETMAKTPPSEKVRRNQYLKLQQELDRLRTLTMEKNPKRTRIPVLAGVFRTPPSDDEFKWQDSAFKLQFSKTAPAVLHWSRASSIKLPQPTEDSKAGAKSVP